MNKTERIYLESLEKANKNLHKKIKQLEEENESLKNDYKVLANYNLDLLDELEELKEVVTMKDNRIRTLIEGRQELYDEIKTCEEHIKEYDDDFIFENKGHC